MCVCMYVCVYVCMYVCMFICMYLFWNREHMYAYGFDMSMCVYYVCKKSAYSSYTHTHMHTWTYIRVYIHRLPSSRYPDCTIRMHTYIHTYAYAYMIHTCIFTHTERACFHLLDTRTAQSARTALSGSCIHTYIRIRVHDTYMHMHTHRARLLPSSRYQDCTIRANLAPCKSPYLMRMMMKMVK